MGNNVFKGFGVWYLQKKKKGGRSATFGGPHHQSLPPLNGDTYAISYMTADIYIYIYIDISHHQNDMIFHEKKFATLSRPLNNMPNQGVGKLELEHHQIWKAGPLK